MSQLNQRGAVSMISVVIFSIIITIVVTAYMRTIVTQQKDAINYDLSTRAFYAAESGVEDARRDGLATSSSDCSSIKDGGLSAGQKYNNKLGSNISYTCQIIEKDPSDISGSVNEQKSAFIRLNPVDPTLPSDEEWRVQLRWSTNGDLTGREDGSKLFLPKLAWAAKAYHPVLRSTVVSHPKNSFTRDQVKQRVLFNNPAVSGKEEVALPRLNQNSEQDPAQLVTNGVCTEAGVGAYKCRRTFVLDNYNFSSQNIYLHLKSIYGATNFQVILRHCTSGDNCTTVSQKDVVATVDVTARAGDVFRRVKQTVPISDDGYKIFDGLDASLVAGDGICKSFKVGTSSAQYSPGCDPTQ